ncbi:acyl-CoA dehydrogenase [[Mycobacterium] vasticus]|uniref:Acyl-CoA dehydrogenase n=1 Tax=[Mycobacterium] vasticus TaxID=2875777 RepID=A0ABU5YYR6_9MYCO|nr:acyl-CoA dehydrogenase [Mycolicibacter sp. MYC017]MEB3070272.1 acyl-CoA dehydrogenase [Mycolicibacter sp. MYC017]
MALAITDEHEALTEVVQSFVAKHDTRAVARQLLDAPSETCPDFWPDIVNLGWLGLHLPEDCGGQGFGLPELAVILEQLARSVTPGPYLPTVLASAVLAQLGAAPELVGKLADGTCTAAVGFGDGLRRSESSVSGTVPAVLGAELADVLLLVVGDDAVVVEAGAKGVVICHGTDLDPTRRAPAVSLAEVPVDVLLSGGARHVITVARLLLAAEATGLASACTDMAVQYAKQREQFGRVIGSFQAIKHLAADMLVSTEMATAAVWDAVRCDPTEPAMELAAAVAAVQAMPAAVVNAQRCIQVHGGIGFTWEHDAGLYLRRASALSALLSALGDAEMEVAERTADGVTRHYGIELPEDAERFRAEAAEAAAHVAGLPITERRRYLAETGYLSPHWPSPWGRGADPAEQLVIEDEFRGVEVPNLGITGWNILTVIQAGTDEQQNRWVPAALAGTEKWCQLFSEPGAGSDAAAIKTKGIRADGGWLVTGQKVWTSGAKDCRWGFATVRTDSSGSKHSGVTMMTIDMTGPGVEIRPLRELTGESLFNEVFLDEVFVPDADVVGPVGEGWAVARAVLGNERISIGGGASRVGFTADQLPPLLSVLGRDDSGSLRTAGELISEQQTLQLLNLRQAARAVTGEGPGPEGNITKLVNGLHIQRVTEFAMKVIGVEAINGGDFTDLVHAYLLGRCYTIAGGTTEIVRNQIAERLLRLPRESLSS